MKKLVLLLGIILVSGCVSQVEQASTGSVPSSELGVGVNMDLPDLSSDTGVNVSSEIPNINSDSLGDAI